MASSDSSEIKIYYYDKDINELLAGIHEKEGVVYTKHYNQNEEFFIQFQQRFSVPSFPIHHDVRQAEPSKIYLKQLYKFLEEITRLVPEVFNDLTWIFNPFEPLKPLFFRLYKIKETNYLYILKVDLAMRPTGAEIETAGTNDATAVYKTNRLFLKGVFVPLEKIEVDQNRIKSFIVRQTIESTWAGERGRGYMLQGIWIDNELTKFFSKLFLPKRRMYPFYPVVCKYNTVCLNVTDLSSWDRKVALPDLHRALEFLTPYLEDIQAELKKSEKFSEQLSLFQKLKPEIPAYWTGKWDNLKVSPYLNEEEQREFRLDKIGPAV